MSKILPNLYLGQATDANNKKLLDELGVTHILIVARELPEFQCQGYSYLKVPAQDNYTYDIAQHFDQMIAFIDEGRAKGAVLVHCMFGVSRSAAAVLAYLIRKKRFSFKRAFDFVNAKRRILPNENFVRQLIVFAEQVRMSHDRKGEGQAEGEGDGRGRVGGSGSVGRDGFLGLPPGMVPEDGSSKTDGVPRMAFRFRAPTLNQAVLPSHVANGIGNNSTLGFGLHQTQSRSPLRRVTLPPKNRELSTALKKASSPKVEREPERRQTESLFFSRRNFPKLTEVRSIPQQAHTPKGPKDVVYAPGPPEKLEKKEGAPVHPPAVKHSKPEPINTHEASTEIPDSRTRQGSRMGLSGQHFLPAFRATPKLAHQDASKPRTDLREPPGSKGSSLNRLFHKYQSTSHSQWRSSRHTGGVDFPNTSNLSRGHTICPDKKLNYGFKCLGCDTRLFGTADLNNHSKATLGEPDRCHYLFAKTLPFIQTKKDHFQASEVKCPYCEAVLGEYLAGGKVCSCGVYVQSPFRMLKKAVRAEAAREEVRE